MRCMCMIDNMLDKIDIYYVCMCVCDDDDDDFKQLTIMAI